MIITRLKFFSILEGSDDRSSTFVFGNEDHTLGNSLRHVLMQREEVEFCGYSVPHPYEPKNEFAFTSERGLHRERDLGSRVEGSGGNRPRYGGINLPGHAQRPLKKTRISEP